MFKMIIIISLVVIFPVSTYAMDLPLSLSELVNSQDVLLSEEAASGIAVDIVENPSEIRGGGILKQKIGLLISQIAQAWRNNPTWGLENLPRELAPRWGRLNNTGIRNGEFTTDLSGWNSQFAYAGATSFGDIVPDAATIDGAFAVAYSGTWDEGSQGYIEQTFRINKAQEMSFSVLYNFVTTEINYLVGGSGPHFNDNAIITLTFEDGTVQFGLFESVNSSTLQPATNLPYVINNGRGQNGSQTGWRAFHSDPITFARGNYTVRIEVNDVSDLYVDSAILVDMVGLE